MEQYDGNMLKGRFKRVSILIHPDKLVGGTWTPPEGVDQTILNNIKDFLFPGNNFSKLRWEHVASRGKDGWNSTWDIFKSESERLQPIPSFLARFPSTGL